MKKFKKLTSAIVSLMMVCTSMGGFTLWSSADDENVTLELKSEDTLSFSVNADAETTYTLNGETNVYKKITLTGKLENGFTVENGEHDIALNNVAINDSVVINPGAKVNIEIEGTNTVKADVVGKAGINVPVGATLNLLGDGTLTAKGSDDRGAGIGGDCSETAGTINIKDGIIEATGGEHAAGIGGGDNGNGGNITISGGTVNATGGEDGAGIGGGYHGNGGNITITEGTVNATGKLWAAGIGGGYHGDGGDITITGGIVNATIETINTLGGKINATGAGIGGGCWGNSGNIIIKNATVTAEGGYFGAGIGGGCGSWTEGECENITIDNSIIISKAGEYAEPIGGGRCYDISERKIIMYDGTCGNVVNPAGGDTNEKYTGIVTINGNELSEETRKQYFEFGSIKVNPDGTVEQYTEDMIVYPNMGEFTVGTSANMSVNDDEITINLRKDDKLSFSVNKAGNPTVTYNGETKAYKKIILTGELENGFAVENGEHDIALNNVIINDSVVIKSNATANIKIERTNTVIAKARTIDGWMNTDTIGKAGIKVSREATLNLFGSGTLTAVGSENINSVWGFGGAGIGGDNETIVGTVSISENVTVNALGGRDAAGIGGGANGVGGNITISGGTVNAIGGEKGAGIGCGSNGFNENITITGGIVTAIGGEKAAGIGSGSNSFFAGNIAISGGTVNATGGNNGAGIGGGYLNSSRNITIYNSEIIATAGEDAEPIGGGAYETNSGTVTINENELSEENRKQYFEFGSIKVNPDGTVVQYIK